jgi:hypothetical protein
MACIISFFGSDLMAGAMRRNLCRIALELALATALAVSPSALAAQTSGQAVYAGSPSEVTLSVNVTASVSASCAFSTGGAPGGTYSVGNVEAPYTVDVSFSLRCNSPSRVGVVSDHGGLQAGDVPSVPAGYARLAPYQIMLSLAGDAGNNAQATCQSPTLLAGAGGCVFRGPATATSGLRLPGPSNDAPGSFIRISSPGYSEPAVLIASNSYADRLTVTISPAS